LPFRRLRAAVLGTLLACALVAPSAHAAAAPSGMFAIGDWAWPTTTTVDRESAKGLRTWRLALDYKSIGATQGTLNFSGTDGLVGSLASRGITPLIVLAGCPTWLCPLGGPPSSSTALPYWKAFVTAAVKRYGAGGTYWAAHPTITTPRPVTAWQVYNEVNGAAQWPNPSPAAYAPFLAATSASIRAADPTAKVVLAGLSEKMTIWMKDFLTGLYAQPGFKDSFDIMALHGYTQYPEGVAPILDTARSIMLANNDAAKPIWMTEIAWATGGPAHPFVVDEATQAARLRASWDTLLACRGRWNLERVYWFGWRDRAVPVGGTDYWGYHDGLNRLDGTAKPALADFDMYTSGAPLPNGRGDTCSLPGGNLIDSVAPDTTITSGPGVRTASTTPGFSFTASESGVHYECHFEGSAWAPCAAGIDGKWHPATPLAEGSHTFSVRAIDATGNVDATPASVTFIVDLTPPDTYVAGTWGYVSAGTVSLTLSANEPVSGYDCKVDSGSWARCTSPFTTTLTAGNHTISVRATDLAGNADPLPASPWYTVG
jgi:hypothetical protein